MIISENRYPLFRIMRLNEVKSSCESAYGCGSPRKETPVVMDAETFVSLALRNPANDTILNALAAMRLPDAWLASSCLVQSVWNALTDRPIGYGISDYDVLYFDSDTSWEAEDRVIKQLNKVACELGVPVQVRNQARVHLWYEQKFGRPYPPLSSATESIDRFLTRNTKVGIRRSDGRDHVYAPNGFDDIARFLITPNRSANFSHERYLEKAVRWKSLWPELTLIEAVP
jgi:hypothetical protein